MGNAFCPFYKGDCEGEDCIFYLYESYTNPETNKEYTVESCAIATFLKHKIKKSFFEFRTCTAECYNYYSEIGQFSKTVSAREE